MSPLPAGQETGPEFQFGSLTEQDRLDIVTLTANFNNTGTTYANYNRVQLTALGADLDIEADWTQGTSSLEKWRHIASTGRDQFVRVVHRGYLYPLGHRAVIINIVERFLLQDPANPGFSDAVLQQYLIIKVQQDVKTYPAFAQPFTADWPFAQVEMKTLVTPPISVGGIGQNTPNGYQLNRIYVESNSEEFQWTYLVTDEKGNEAHVTGPMCFMNAGDPEWPSEYVGSNMDTIAGLYNGLTGANLVARQGALHGEHLMFADEGGGQKGCTTHPTYQLTFAAATVDYDPVAEAVAPNSAPDPSDMLAELQPAFYPVLMQAAVRLPAADGLSRGAFVDQSTGGTGVGLQYYPDFVTNGYGPANGNPGEVYMALTDYVKDQANAPALKFPADAVGGIGTPNIMVSGLSTTAGLVSGELDHFAQNNGQNPLSYFPSALTGTDAPQFFGGLLLSNLISGGNSSPPDMQLPAIVNSLDTFTGERTISYSLEVTLLAWPQNTSTGPIFIPDPAQSNVNQSTGTLTLNATVEISPSGQSSFVIHGVMTPFTVNILGSAGGLNFIQIPFNRAEFTSQSGKKPDIKVDMGNITFQGALQFVNVLEQFLEDLGGSGFKITVTPSAISAGFSFTLPDISIGMLDISGLGLSASVDVPFLGQPATATFSFASKEKPFTVCVSMFGGSGYITLVLGLHQVQQVTAGADFGGNFELNLGVASGGIQLVAGIFYNYSDTTGVQLTGYVKLSGGVTVLGFLSFGVSLDLELTYQENNGQSWVTGSATLTISVGIFCFHVSFGFTIQKQFSGSGSPPAAQDPNVRARGLRRGLEPDANPGQFQDPVTAAHFSDLMSVTNWDNYCAVFSA